ncbi:head decoration protein [Methylobacterium thuringiense]|uniref:Head decoration protein n=1 Tax=Methylobacterium thuringiense TaxID=1003091 RepID=A0ABQ4TGZ8_9HYPH|nr:head decoration protein [Methylobacterium thuringiense]GJE54571.1 hypothetical protein EKPJFOCH_1049 [Methylobacterium thuringiense]
MASVLLNPVYVADWLKYESPSYHSRDTATIASGSGVLVSGTVLAKVVATGKYVPAAATGSDGSQTASAILIIGALDNLTVDATSADQKAVILTRHADVSHAGITYGPTINDATKRAAANGQLAALGIVVREGA